VVVKAAVQGLHFLDRTGVPPKTALVTGAGPIGLLAALGCSQYGLETHVVDIVESGPKPALVRDLGAHYHAGSAADLDISAEVIIECTGLGQVLRAAGSRAAPGAVIALTGISSLATGAEFDFSVLNKRLVLGNIVLFGSVNSARSHYERAANVLAQADRAWLTRLISRRVTAENWHDAVERRPDDVKVVLEIGRRAA
jgi:threonine dehydrogenase-like Zn-dependent dehydrogenase